MGEEKGLKLFQDIVAKNGMSVRKGHTLLANFVGSGEVPLALTAYSYRVEQLKKRGRAGRRSSTCRRWSALPTGAGVFKRAPHPHAALLLLGFHPDRRARRSWPIAKRCRPIRRSRPAPKDLIFVDLPKFLDEGDKWTKLFKETFADHAR